MKIRASIQKFLLRIILVGMTLVLFVIDNEVTSIKMEVKSPQREIPQNISNIIDFISYINHTEEKTIFWHHHLLRNLELVTIYSAWSRTKAKTKFT